MKDSKSLHMNEMKPPLNHVTQGSVHLDAMRGAAALMVFLNHTRALYFGSALDSYDNAAKTPLSLSQQNAPVPVLNAGTQGVENGTGADVGLQELLHGEIKMASEAVIIFFVLSGYLVGGSVLRSVRKHYWSWKVYLTKRLTRLYMVLLPALALTVGLDHLGLHLARSGSVYSTPRGIQIVTTSHLLDHLRPLAVLGNGFFLQGILVPDVGTNVSIWSLGNEFWYYIIFPLLMLAVATGKLWLRLIYIVSAALVFWFVGAAIALQFPLWLMGALLLLLPQRLTERQARTGSLVSLMLLLVTMIGVRLLHQRPIVADYILGLTACVLLFFLVQQRAPAKPGLYKGITGFFSRISYSLYLFHLPIAVFLCSRFNQPWVSWAKTPAHAAEFLAIDAGIVAVVWCLWRVFEANTDKVRAWLFDRETANLPVSSS